MLLLLEDDPARVDRFTVAIRNVDPSLNLLVWRDAPAMIADLPRLLPAAALILLDHDLVPRQPGVDPGDGLDLTRYLVSQPLKRPVIIHSSNAARADQMLGEFQLADWPCTRVLPYGDLWIETDWTAELRRSISPRNPR